MKKLLFFTITLMTLLFSIPLAHTVLAASAPETPPQVTEKMTRLPFQGSAQSMETYVTVYPTVSGSANGWGNAALLGQFTMSYETQVNFMDLSVTESVRFVGINGDSLQAEAVGQATEDKTLGVLHLIEIYKVTGGTGQFTGARGTITLNRQITVTTGAASSTFDGYILVPWK